MLLGPLPGLLPRSLQLPSVAGQHPSHPPLPPMQSFFLCVSCRTSLYGPALSQGRHCSCSPSPGRKSLVIHFLCYTQADVRSADHSQQVRKAIQGFLELLYPQHESFPAPQKPQVSRGQRWPDASCIRLPDTLHGEGQVTSSMKHLVKCFVG